MYIDERAQENPELQELVIEGIRETLDLFRDYPEMFSTEGDCKGHLFHNVGNKSFQGRRLLDPHPVTRASSVRAEWKRYDSDEPIDLMIIDAKTFEVKAEAETKKKGAFGSADTNIVIEVKGPQWDEARIRGDIQKVSDLLEIGPLANKGFVVVFAGERRKTELETLQEVATEKGVELFYETTDHFPSA